MASNILECGSKDRGKKWRIRASRSSPAERSLRSSGCLQTLITSANGGPFLNRDDANIYIYIDACRHLIPGRRRRRRRVVQLSLSSSPFPSSPPHSFWTSFERRDVPADLPATGVPPCGNPMETYLSGCPDDAKSNFVSQEGGGRGGAREPPVKSAPRERWKCASGTRLDFRRMSLYPANWINYLEGVVARIAADNRPLFE